MVLDCPEHSLHKEPRMVSRLLEHLLNLITRLRGERYIAPLYLQMHEAGRFRGETWKKSMREFEQLVPELQSKVILDFGCGPRGGVAEHFGESVISFDPYVPQYSALPWNRKFDVVFSGDVLEHMRLREIQTFLTQIRESAARYVFLVISTRPAGKRLPNGANAHLTVKPSEWWTRKMQVGLSPDFELIYAKADVLRQDVAICFRRRANASSTQVPRCAA
jgi:hypothetical protein